MQFSYHGCSCLWAGEKVNKLKENGELHSGWKAPKCFSLCSHAVLMASSQGLRLLSLSWMEIIESSQCPGLLTVPGAAKHFDLLQDGSVWSQRTLLKALPVCFGLQRWTLFQHLHLPEQKLAEARYLGTCFTSDQSSDTGLPQTSISCC